MSHQYPSCPSLIYADVGELAGMPQKNEKNMRVLQERHDSFDISKLAHCRTSDFRTGVATLASATWKATVDDEYVFNAYLPGDDTYECYARISFAQAYVNHPEYSLIASDLDETTRTALSEYQEFSCMELPEMPLNGLEGTQWDSEEWLATARGAILGAHTSWELDKVASVARNQALVTHGAQSSTLSSSLAAMVVHGLLIGDISPGRILDTVRDKNYMDFLPEKDAMCSMLHYLNYIDVEADPYIVLNPDFDMCALYGKGYTAQEVFVLSALIADAFMSRGVTAQHADNAIRRAAHITGNTQGVGYLAGMFVGAAMSTAGGPGMWQQTTQLLSPQHHVSA